ncbi:pentatricopeptide repeat-containing protein At4g17616 [Syzygium oleosum]|uniref:pentatricopeptide repeat-containing protein At4g17616 n=1 Tax=Syzygium oleosum TaxID=219896 RepID=UPI0011D27CC3|nr:pentatricopeptide repeat-containing protein At4g17616 [Syzygium oleosum]
MALTTRGEIIVHHCTGKSHLLRLFFPYFNQKRALSRRQNREFILCKNTKIAPNSTRALLLEKLGVALKDHQIEEAWDIFKDYRKSYDISDCSLINRLLTGLSYSSDPQWLRRACDLVFKHWKRKSHLFHVEVLAKLALSVARVKMPVPASMILRLLLEKKYLPPFDILNLVLLHMVKTEIGTYLASNLLFQMSDSYQHITICGSNLRNKMKSDTIIFNLVLDACVRFGSALKGQDIIEFMAQSGVVADAHSINIIAQIYEMNGQRDEIKNYKGYVDRIPVALVPHYQSFYNSLLSLHFKFTDISAAAELVLDLDRYREALPLNNEQRPHLVSVGSSNLKSGLKMRILPEQLDIDRPFEAERKEDLVAVRNGKFNLTNKALAKFIYGYRRIGRIGELSKLLLSIQEQNASLGRYHLFLCVINACIGVGWPETAHDLLDDFEFAGAAIDSSAHIALLEAYYERGMLKEANGLVKQMKKSGVLSSYFDKTTIFTSVLEKAATSEPSSNVSFAVEYSDLTKMLVQTMEEEEKSTPCVLYELNTSIYFFCKAKMMEDALKTYRRMQEMEIQPNEQTFAILVRGYSSWQMYRDITILWGDMKRSMTQDNFVISRDLCESLVLSFIRGGYFERVMEVISFMMDHKLFADKGMYRYEFLKLHKNLYRNLSASEARTEAQRKRLEHVREFRKWARID